MAVFTLQSLAPRSVSVVYDGQSVGLRLGAESQTTCRTPEVRINPRHPSPNGGRGFMPAQRPDDHAEYDRMAASAAYGAGRSHSRDGSLSRRSPARIAGGKSLRREGFRPHGTPKSQAAKRLSTTKRDAARNTAAVARPLPLNASTETTSAVSSARRWPADRTLSASTWAS